MSEISERIKSAIKSSGLSHRELEKKTGIPHSAIQRYAAGTTDNIPINRLEKLASALDTTAEYLIGWKTKDDVPKTRAEEQKDTDPLPSADELFPSNDEESVLKRKIINLTDRLTTEEQLRQVLDFMEYLEQKREKGAEKK